MPAHPTSTKVVETRSSFLVPPEKQNGKKAAKEPASRQNNRLLERYRTLSHIPTGKTSTTKTRATASARAARRSILPAESARPARSRGGELESFPFQSGNQALMRELLVTHAKRQPRERERHHQPVQRGAAHCRPRKRDLRITGGELERLPLLNLKAEPRHAKNRYQCNTSSTTRPREARVAKSGILPAERARLAQEKKKKRPAWPAGAVQSATCGALCAANHRKDHNSDLILFRQ